MIVLEQITDLYKQKDGSYVVFLDGVPYHKPNKDEWKEDWELLSEFEKTGKVICKSWEDKQSEDTTEEIPNGNRVTIDLSSIAANPYKKYTTQFGTWIESTIPTGEKVLEGYGTINYKNYTSLLTQNIQLGYKENNEEIEPQFTIDATPLMSQLYAIPLPKGLEVQNRVSNLVAVNITDEAKNNYKSDYYLHSTQRINSFGTCSSEVKTVSPNYFTSYVNAGTGIKDPATITGANQLGSVMNEANIYKIISFLSYNHLNFMLYNNSDLQKETLLNKQNTLTKTFFDGNYIEWSMKGIIKQ